MTKRGALIGLMTVLALVGASCGSSGSDDEGSAPVFVEQGAQAIDTSDIESTTTEAAAGSAGVAEGAAGQADDATAGDDTDAGTDGGEAEGGATTTLPQNEVTQEESIDDLFAAMRTFNSCLEDEGQPFIGFDPEAPADDPRQAPAYLEALQKCAAVSQIQEALASVDLGSEGKTPEEIEQQNRGLVSFTDCLKGRGWNPAPMEPDENGLLQIGDLGPPDGESIFESDDMDECRRIGQDDAEAQAEAEAEAGG